MSYGTDSSDAHSSPSLEQALGLVLRMPEDEAVWDRAESLAEGRADAQAIAEAYRHVLRQPHPVSLLLKLGERAVQFHREWCSEDPDGLVEVLERLLEIDRGADWALRQLIVVLTLREDWDRLLGNYDRALSGAEKGRRGDLLAEAAQIAKDFLGSAERAVGYLRPLFALRPSDPQVAASLERLLDRLERYDELVDVWMARLGEIPADEGAALRVRIADVRHERLAAYAAALEAVRPLRPQRRHLALAVSRLGALLGDSKAPTPVRLEAARWLASFHDEVDHPDDALAVVLEGLGFAAGMDRATLLAEAARRFVKAGRESEAVEQLSALLPLVPADRAVEDELFRLCDRTGLQKLGVRGILDAARATDDGAERVRLTLRAAVVFENVLQEATEDKTEEAIALYQQVTRDAAASRADRVQALGRLETLWELTARPELRLEALCSLVELVDRPSELRALLGVTAKLAFALRQWERAVGAWRRVLATQPRDVEALDGQVDTLVEAQRWSELVEALRQRCEASEDPRAKAADLAQAAVVQAERLAAPAAAVALWREREERFGPTEEGVDAEANLLAATARFGELAAVLTRDAARERVRAAGEGVRLGEALTGQLGESARAAEAFAHALAADPAHAEAREGLWALVRTADPAVRAQAVAALTVAADRLDDRVLALALVEPRVIVAADAADIAKQGRILADGVMRAERDARDLSRARSWAARAAVLVPTDQKVEEELVRLAETTGHFEEAVASLRAGAAALPRGERRRVALLTRAAHLAEERLSDGSGAARDFLEALALEPGRLDLRRACVRTSLRARRFDDVAAVLLGTEVPELVRAAVLLPEAETEARSGRAFAELGAALSAMLPQRAEVLGAAHAAAIEVRVAGWYEKELADSAAAERALRRALVFAPSDVTARERLASLERRHPDAGLFETLMALGELRPSDLDAWSEALDVATELAAGERAIRTGQVAGRLFERAARLLAIGQPALGARTPDVTSERAALIYVAWLLSTEKEKEAGEGQESDENALRAHAVCRTAAALPLAPSVTRTFGRMGADIAVRQLSHRGDAIDSLGLVLRAHPDDGETLADLGRLYFHEERWAELFALRRYELDRTPFGGDAGERRLSLRLDMEQLGGRIETTSERLALLKANLAESPGHGPTLEALTVLLAARQEHGQLVDILEAEATTLEGLHEAERSAELWTRAARWAETALADKRRAIAAHERAVTLVVAPSSLDDLGRLCMDGEVNEPEAAARWLDKLLSLLELTARPEIAVRLARAYLTAGRRHRAIAALQRTLAELPAARVLRDMLADLYRSAGALEPLARLLCEGTAYVEDPEEMVALAREARDLCQKVNLPALAVQALGRAHVVAPDDHDLALALGRALAAANEHDKAAAIFATLLKTTRRATERATLFHELGLVQRAQGRLEEALAAFEQAASIDGENVRVLSDLATAAEASQHFDRAERALRALMLLARRPDRPAGTVSVADVLLSLHTVTLARGQDEKAKEILDSALEAAVQTPTALARLRERLEATGDLPTLANVLEKRAATAGEASLEAATWRELAEVQMRLGTPDLALTTLLRAIRISPSDKALHARTREVACGQEGGLERYLSTIESFVERRRRREDSGLVARLLLWAGTLVEEEAKDGDKNGGKDAARALAYYLRAADVNEVAAEALACAARVARAVDPSTRRAVLDKLARLARQGATPEEQANLLFRLAEAELEEPASREAGLSSLSAAIDLQPDLERALALVGRAQIRDEELPRILPLYERTARERGDERLLLDCLLRRARGAHPRPELLREGYDLALALHEDAAAEEFLDVLAAVGRAISGAEGEAAWALIERARRCRARGDLAHAYASLASALEVGEAARVLPALRDLSRQVLERATGSAGSADAALGAQILETLRARQPDDSSLVTDLLSLYERLPDRLGYERLMRDLLERAPSVTERNPLRLRLATFLAKAEPDDASVLDLLQDVLMEEPGHNEAAAQLALAFERRGDLDRLHALLVQQLADAETRNDVATVVELVKKLAAPLLSERPEEAIDLYRRGLAAEPGERELIARLLALYATADAGRVEVMDRILDAQPNQAAWLSARQSTYERAELWEPLAKLFEAQATRETDLGQTASRLRAAAEIYRQKLYDAEAAAELLRRARAVRPADVDIACELVSCLVELGRGSEAVNQGQLALRQLGSQTSPEAKITLLRLVADLLAEQAHFSEAISLYQDALAIAPSQLQGDLELTLIRLKGDSSPPDAPEDTNPGDAIPLDEILIEITNELP